MYLEGYSSTNSGLTNINPEDGKRMIDDLGWKVIDSNANNSFDSGDTVVNEYGYTVYKSVTPEAHEEAHSLKARNDVHLLVFFNNASHLLSSGNASFKTDSQLVSYINHQMRAYSEIFTDGACSLYTRTADSYCEYEFLFAQDWWGGVKMTEAVFFEHRPGATFSGTIVRSKIQTNTDPDFATIKEKEGSLNTKALLAHLVYEITGSFSLFKKISG